MEEARNCFEYKLSGDWRVGGEKRGGGLYCADVEVIGLMGERVVLVMIFNEILDFDLIYILFGGGKGLNQNLEIRLISSMNHKQIIDLYI